MSSARVEAQWQCLPAVVTDLFSSFGHVRNVGCLQIYF